MAMLRLLARDSGAVAVVPEVVDFHGLEQRLEPSSGEKALLVNFWATW